MGSKKRHTPHRGPQRELGRVYPPKSERERILSCIDAIPEAQRSAGEWYTLGSLLIYEATLDEDDLKLNRGTDALVRAAVVKRKGNIWTSRRPLQIFSTS
jgi:hypothetical protein